MSYDNNLELIIKRVVSEKPNAPVLRASVEIDGTKYKASLWTWTRKDGSKVTDKNGNPQWKGKLEVDTYEPNGKQAEPKADDFNDEIPF